MAKGHLLRKFFRLLVIPFLVSQLQACSDGGDDTQTQGWGATRAWVRIDSPVDGYSTGNSSVIVEGNAAMRDASDNTFSSVFWQTDVASGIAKSSVTCIVTCIVAWQATVPLDLGDNVITIKMEDGTDQITVSRFTQVVINGQMTMDSPSGVSVPDIPLVLASSDTTYRDTVTDLFGNYSFSNVKAGTYSLYPTQPPLPQSSSCLLFMPTSRDITVPHDNNNDINGQDFISSQVEPCYFISGRVTVSNNPSYDVEGIMITLTDQSGNSMIRYTDGGGYFIFNHFEPGTYTLIPSYCGFITPCATFTPEFIEVNIIDDNAFSQDFVRDFN